MLAAVGPPSMRLISVCLFSVLTSLMRRAESPFPGPAAPSPWGPSRLCDMAGEAIRATRKGLAKETVYPETHIKDGQCFYIL